MQAVLISALAALSSAFPQPQSGQELLNIQAAQLAALADAAALQQQIIANQFLAQQKPADIAAENCPNYPNCATNSAVLGANPVVPPGVDLNKCPGYPICDNNLPVAPQPVAATVPAAVVPAGIDPARCPGYPFYSCQ